MVAFLALWAASAAAANDIIEIAYLGVQTQRPPVLATLDRSPDDPGIAGAQTALAELNTAGVFLGQVYRLKTVTVPVGEDPLEAAEQLLDATRLLVLDAPAEVLTAIADLPAAQGALLFNTSSGDPSLRNDACRSNLLHTIPSTAMRTDALAQFFLSRRRTDFVMISGKHAIDQSYAASVRRSLQKFGLTLKAEKTWDFNAGMRRSAAAEMPLFTQDFGDYDTLIVADEVHDFGRYVMYNTWQARPVAGSEGLTPVTWSPVIEDWGAVQLQRRFEKLTGRGMTSGDYAAWAALRVIGEAVSRTGSADPLGLRDYILSDAFEIAGFKGRPLTFRTWNGQLRQPIALTHPRGLVASVPLEGFMHQTNALDTLGFDRPESTCALFR
ncbi:ABC transporter substrate-binding protein [Roseobacter ponti]|uniref:ABC transporter substrate-binding protein n=2 Tax=Roseobacter ponti TaxID=1891787 RepID=A0A858SWB3_9RHOB|nr:ABC transporter substrate-binding protein [Roseobacter ponti]